MMRHFINLVESLHEQRLFEGHGVDPRNIILKTCVSVFTGKYWDRRPHTRDMHNDHAWDMFDDYNEDMPEEIQDMDPDEAIATSAFKRWVLRWAQARYRNVESKLSSLPRGPHGVKVSRMMRVPLSKFADAQRSGATDLGVHWTFAPDQWDMNAVWAKTDEGDDVVIDAEVAEEHIDWFNTYMANMDYYSGDEEHEIRIKPGAPVHVLRVRDSRGNDVDIAGIRFTA